jgi:hypothetical protein
VSRELFLVLLRLVRQHLADDMPTPPAHERSHATWWAVQTFIDENFSAGMNRDSIAAAMNLHPNYLPTCPQRRRPVLP